MVKVCKLKVNQETFKEEDFNGKPLLLNAIVWRDICREAPILENFTLETYLEIRKFMKYLCTTSYLYHAVKENL